MKPKIIGLSALAAAAVSWAGAAAETQSVADIFVKLDLVGTWSADCKRPASQENPYYIVQQPQAPGAVHRETRNGQASVSTTIDVAHELNLNELLVSLFDGGDSTSRIKAVWLIERHRLRVSLFVTNDGRTIITGGKVVANGTQTPWINRCDQ
jgi:hypothetical protein